MSYRKPIQKNQEFIFFTSLVSQADGRVFQASPTLAVGDVKVSSDDGATHADITTLPTVTTANNKILTVTLSASEMNADNGTVTVIFSDAAGDEWCDQLITVDADLNSAGVVQSAVNDASATTTSFDTDLTETTDDHYNDAYLVFTSGNLKDQARKISDYNGTTKVITLATALTEAPADNDEFMILGRSE